MLQQHDVFNRVSGGRLSAPSRPTVSAMFEHLSCVSSIGTMPDRSSVAAFLQETKCCCVVAPNICKCLKCNQELEEPVAHKGSKPVFYEEHHPGRPGLLLTRTCKACALIYHADGYEAVSTSGTSSGCKTQYPNAAYNNSKWFVSTRETVISLDILALQTSGLKYAYVGFEAQTNIINDRLPVSGEIDWILGTCI